MKKIAQLICISSGLLLAACGDNVGGQPSNGSAPAPDPQVITVPEVSISDIGIVPSINGRDTTSYLFVHNTGKDAAVNVAFSVDNKDFKLDANQCKNIPVNGSCVLELTAHASANASVATVVRAVANEKELDHKAFMVDYVVQETGDSEQALSNGIQAHPIKEIASSKDAYYSTLVVSLSNVNLKDIKSLAVNAPEDSNITAGSVYCPKKSSLAYLDTCSVELKISPKADDVNSTEDDNKVELTPVATTTKGKEIEGQETTVSFLPEGSSPLVLPTVISDDHVYGQTIKLPLMNSSKNPVKSILVSSENEHLEINDSDCHSLDANSVCFYTFQVKDKTLFNGKADIKVSYRLNAKTTKNEKVEASYSGDNTPVALDVYIEEGDFDAKVSGDPVVKKVTVVNNSVREMNNLAAALGETMDANGFTVENTTNEEGCFIPGKALKAGATCTFNLVYTPGDTVVEETEGEVTVTGKYQDVHNETKDYTSSPFVVTYKAEAETPQAH